MPVDQGLGRFVKPLVVQWFRAKVAFITQVVSQSNNGYIALAPWILLVK